MASHWVNLTMRGRPTRSVGAFWCGNGAGVILAAGFGVQSVSLMKRASSARYRCVRQR